LWMEKFIVVKVANPELVSGSQAKL
jgi:hypothetical protein